MRHGKEAQFSPFLFLISSMSGIAITYGIGRYAYGLFLPEFIEDFSISLSFSGSLSGWATALYATLAVVCAIIAKRYRPILFILIGGMLTVLGMLLIATSKHYLAFSSGVILASFGAGIIPPAYFEIIGQLIDEEKQDLVTVCVSTSGTFGLAVCALAAHLIGTEWRLAWLLFSLVSLLVVLLNVMAVPWSNLPDNSTGVSVIPRKLSELLPDGWRTLFAMSSCYGAALSIYYTFSISYLRFELQRADITDMFWLLIGLSGILAILVTSMLVAKIGVIRTICFSYAMLACAFLVIHAWGIGSILVSGFIFGIFSIVPNSACLIFANRIYNERFSLGWGVVFVTMSVGMTIGVTLAGFAADTFSIQNVFNVVSALLAILAVGFFLGDQTTRKLHGRSI